MGRGDNRLTAKMRKRKSQRKKKAKIVAAKSGSK
jgi:hypothetical protein